MTATITLPPKLDLGAAEGLLADLRTVTVDVALDASAVTQFGALAAQTILVAAAAFAGTGRALRFSACSDAAADQLARMGLSPQTLETGG